LLGWTGAEWLIRPCGRRRRIAVQGAEPLGQGQGAIELALVTGPFVRENKDRLLNATSRRNQFAHEINACFRFDAVFPNEGPRSADVSGRFPKLEYLILNQDFPHRILFDYDLVSFATFRLRLQEPT
jgi:hypothetical protein